MKKPEVPLVTKPPIDSDTLAEAIVKISAGLAGLRRSGLNTEAIVILVSASTGETRTTCRRVIDGLGSLQRSYCK